MMKSEDGSGAAGNLVRLGISEAIVALPDKSRAVLERRLLSLRDSSETDVISPSGDRSKARLSYAQRGLWLNYQIDPRSWAYNITASLLLKGSLNAELLVWSFRQVVKRHEVLRTAFAQGSDEPVAILQDVELHVPVKDLTAVDSEKRLQLALKWGYDHARRPFNHAQAPLLRVSIVKLSSDEHALFMAIDHLVADGWSINILIREVQSFYEGRVSEASPQLKPLPLQYGDFAHWQERDLKKSAGNGLSFWRQKLQGLKRLNLPTDHPRPTKPSLEGARATFTIPREVTSRLREISKQEQVTVFMTLLAAYKILLGEYSGSEDVMVGTGSANRDRQEIVGLIGLFANMLVLRTDLSGCRTFRDILQRVRQTTLDAHKYRDVPFEKLVEELQPERKTTGMPFIQTSMMLDESKQSGLQISGVTITPLNVASETARYDWFMSLYDGDELRGALIYKSQLWEAATIASVTARFCELVDVLTREPNRALSELSVLTRAAEASPVNEAAQSLPKQPGQVAPQSASEMSESSVTLAQIWKELLKVDSVSVDDDFFDLGGNSLLALRLLGDIQKRCGTRVSMSAFFDQPTLGGVLALLEAHRGESGPIDDDPLVQIRRGPDSTALFCVHPQSGDIRCFSTLAQHLSSLCSFYAFRAPFPADQVRPVHESIEALAGEYVISMRRVQSGGPYLIGGYSSGSVVAFEMARQLQRAGHSVALLVLLDGLCPLESQHVQDRSHSFTLAGIVRDMARSAGVPLQLPHEVIKSLPTEEGIEFIMKRVAESGLEMKTDRDWLRNLLTGLANRMEIGRAYQPSLYNGDVALFRSNEAEPESAKAWLELGVDVRSKSRGWDKLLFRDPSVHFIPGYHATLLNGQSAERLAEGLRIEITRARHSGMRTAACGVLDSNARTTAEAVA